MSAPAFRGSMLAAMLASGWGPYNLVEKRNYRGPQPKNSRTPYPVYVRASGFAGIPRSTGLREHESNNGANILLNNKRPGDTHRTSAFRHFDISSSPQV